MASASQLAQARAHAEAKMTETVEVGKFADDVDENLNPIVVLVEDHYTGIGEISYPSLAVSDRVAASQQFASVAPVLKIPAGAGVNVRQGDTVHVSASNSDASLVGRKFRIGAWPQSGQVTAHRYPLEESS